MSHASVQSPAVLNPKIEAVERFNESLGEAGGAEKIKYQSPRVGSVEQTVQSFIGVFVTPEMFGAEGDGLVDDSDAIEAALNSSDGPRTVLLPNRYRITRKLTVANGSGLRVTSFGVGGLVAGVAGTLIVFQDVGALLNCEVSGLSIKNDGFRSREGLLYFKKPNNCKVHNIDGNSNSYASVLIEYDDPFCSEVSNVNLEAAGGGIAFKAQGSSLNLSTLKIGNIFCNAGTVTFIGGVPLSGTAQLIETVTVENLHALRATATEPKLAEVVNVNGSQSGESSVFVGAGNDTKFSVGAVVYMGNVGQLEHNYIDSVSGTGWVDLRYPVIASSVAGSQMISGDIGIVFSGQSTYNVEMKNTHVESLGVGVLASDIKHLKSDGLFASNYKTAVKLDAVEGFEFRQNTSYASLISVKMFELSGVVSLGSGRKCNRGRIIDIHDIGNTIVPDKVVNNSGNELELYLPDDSQKVLVGRKQITLVSMGNIAASSVEEFEVVFNGIRIGDALVASVNGSLPASVNFSAHVKSDDTLSVLISNPTGSDHYVGDKYLTLAKVM